MIYIVILIIFAIPVFVYEGKSRRKTNVKDWSRLVYAFECLLLILLFGLRNYVGGDTISYIYLWDLIPSFKEINLLNFSASRFMPFWYLFCAACKSVNGEFWVLTLAHATVVNVIMFYMISKITQHKFTAVLVYYLYPAFYFNCEIMRESMAACFFLLAMPYFMKKEWGKYYGLCFVAYMFHSSATLCFLYPLLYSFATRKLTLQSIVIISVIAGILFVGPIFENLSEMLPDALNIFKVTRYKELTNATWMGTVREILTSVILFIIIHERDKRINVNNLVDAGLKFYWLLITLGIGMHILTNRFSNYFRIFVVLIIVKLIWDYKKKSLIVYLFIANTIFGQYRLYVRESSDYYLEGYHFYDQFHPYYSIFEEVPEDIKNKRIQYMSDED